MEQRKNLAVLLGVVCSGEALENPRFAQPRNGKPFALNRPSSSYSVILHLEHRGLGL